jgi:ketosteroid isomerase-like protein
MAEMIQEHVQEAIEESVRKFMELYKKSDGAGVAALYTDDAIVMPPGLPEVEGKAAIGQLFKGLKSMGIAELVCHIVEVGHIGDWAIERSTFELLGEEGQELDHGKYLVLWHREQGEWKMHRDIFNSSVPPK